MVNLRCNISMLCYSPGCFHWRLFVNYIISCSKLAILSISLDTLSYFVPFSLHLPTSHVAPLPCVSLSFLSTSSSLLLCLTVVVAVCCYSGVVHLCPFISLFFPSLCCLCLLTVFGGALVIGLILSCNPFTLR